MVWWPNARNMLLPTMLRYVASTRCPRYHVIVHTCVFVTRVFLVFFRQQPETTFEQCSFDFRIPGRHDIAGKTLNITRPDALVRQIQNYDLEAES